jgi:hypothetical protein
MNEKWKVMSAQTSECFVSEKNNGFFMKPGTGGLDAAGISFHVALVQDIAYFV